MIAQLPPCTYMHEVIIVYTLQINVQLIQYISNHNGWVIYM